MKGRQTPQIKVEPEFAYSDGDDASKLSAGYGLELDSWQKRVITAWLGRDENDKYTAQTAGLSVPR